MTAKRSAIRSSGRWWPCGNSGQRKDRMDDTEIDCIATGETLPKTVAYEHVYSTLREICLTCQECLPQRICRSGHC